jgi:nucleotide-diphospho-sugar transferase
MPPSVCVLTAHDSRYKSIASISVPSIRALADAHAYTLRTIERDDCTRRGGWIKIESIRQVLEEGFDFVLWLDADIYVARQDIDIRNVIRPEIHLHMAWHKPAPRPDGDPPHFNTGVMLIRASDWSRQFFGRVWETGPLNHRWNDQATILHLLGYDRILNLGENRLADIDQAPLSQLNIRWNSIPGVCASDDPIIWHFAGLEISERLRLMQSLANSGH